jgi:hypothetical protein
MRSIKFRSCFAYKLVQPRRPPQPHHAQTFNGQTKNVPHDAHGKQANGNRACQFGIALGTPITFDWSPRGTSSDFYRFARPAQPETRDRGPESPPRMYFSPRASYGYWQMIDGKLLQVGRMDWAEKAKKFGVSAPYSKLRDSNSAPLGGVAVHLFQLYNDNCSGNGASRPFLGQGAWGDDSLCWGRHLKHQVTHHSYP